MSFLINPFIPDRHIKSAIISCDCPKNIITKLNKYNIETIKTVKNNELCDGLSGHADLQINVVNNIAVAAPFAFDYYSNVLKEFTVIKGDSKIQATYPNDIAYNVAVINKMLFHNIKYTEEKLKNLYTKLGFGIQNVKQGYTKCTTCIVSEKAIITEDYGIARIIASFGIDVLTVTQGDVSLNGYANGFLGGASGLVDKNTLAFCGEIKNHRDYKKIKDFTAKHKVDIISLSNDILTDIGSIIPIKQ